MNSDIQTEMDPIQELKNALCEETQKKNALNCKKIESGSLEAYKYIFYKHQTSELKVTEALIEARVNTDPEVNTKRIEVAQAQLEYDLARAETEVIQMRLRLYEVHLLQSTSR